MSPVNDLLAIVPSRNRPRGIARLLDAVHATKKLDTHVHVCIDDDDPAKEEYEQVFAHAAQDGDRLESGPRKGVAAWTNEIAVRRHREYRFLASVSDDMVPRTPGWDHYLTQGISDMGGTGMTYPYNGTRDDIPEAVVMSSDIVAALGWMCLPTQEHWYIDDVWAELGRRTGSLRHMRAVHIEHVHPGAGKASYDRTNMDSSENIEKDRASYREWRSEQMYKDIETVAKLRQESQQRVLQAAAP